MKNNFVITGKLVYKRADWEMGKFFFVVNDGGMFEIYVKPDWVYGSVHTGDIVTVTGAFKQSCANNNRIFLTALHAVTLVGAR